MQSYTIKATIKKFNKPMKQINYPNKFENRQTATPTKMTIRQAQLPRKCSWLDLYYYSESKTKSIQCTRWKPFETLET